MNSVIFVCLGNICRSPIAEGIAKKIVLQKGYRVRVSSAGTGNWHEGEAPCKNSILVAQKNGVDIGEFAS